MDPTLDSCCAREEQLNREHAETKGVLLREADKRGLGFAPHRSARQGVACLTNADSAVTSSAVSTSYVSGELSDDSDGLDTFLDELDGDDAELDTLREARMNQLEYVVLCLISSIQSISHANSAGVTSCVETPRNLRTITDLD